MNNLNPLYTVDKNNQIDRKTLFEYYYIDSLIINYYNLLYDEFDDYNYQYDVDKKAPRYRELKSLLDKIDKYRFKYENDFLYNNYDFTVEQLNKALKILKTNPVFKTIYSLALKNPKIVEKSRKEAIQKVKMYFNKDNYRENYYTKEREESTIRMSKDRQKDINGVISEYKKDFVNCYRGIYAEEKNTNSQQFADKVKKDFRKIYPILINRLKEFIIKYHKDKNNPNYIICALGGSLICGFYNYSKQQGFVPDDNGIPCIQCGNVANYVIYLTDKKRDFSYPLYDYYDSPIFMIGKGWQNGQWNVIKVV